MGTTPLIDVIVLSLSTVEELDRCLAGLDNALSPLLPKNWIIVDDAGKEQAAETAKFFAHTRDKVTVIRNEKKLYLAHSVNRAFRVVQGKHHIVCLAGVAMEDKGLLDKLLYPFFRDPKAVMTIANCRCDWNSFPPYAMSHKCSLPPDLWAISAAGLELLGNMDTSVDDRDAFARYSQEAAKVASVWAIPNVRTMTTHLEWPKRLPGPEELCKRAASNPTILAKK
jgi:hypothetical protein